MAQNAFETVQRKMIPAVLLYVESANKVLMIHRASREGDIHSGKWNGLGGKLEADESALQAAKRELFEESGLDLPLENFESRGVLHFPNFKAHKNEDWLVFLFWIHAESKLSDQSLPKIPEGQPDWIEKEKILGLNLWPGDQIFLPLLLRGEKIVGTFWYENGEVKQSWIDRLK